MEDLKTLLMLISQMSESEVKSVLEGARTIVDTKDKPNESEIRMCQQGHHVAAISDFRNRTGWGLRASIDLFRARRLMPQT